MSDHPFSARFQPGFLRRGRHLRTRRLAAALTVLLLAAGAAPLAERPAAGASAMPQAQAIIHGQVFRLDVADTTPLQTRGLAGRARLGAHEGMVFVYADKSRQTFWMKGMLIPIDIIWLDNGVVVYIAHDVPPPTPGTPDDRLPTYQPEQPANLVLELAAGRSRELGLKVGDLVTFHFNVP